MLSQYSLISFVVALKPFRLIKLEGQTILTILYTLVT
nr:MAG TPA: hypothetical protein [Caudoviricetes sp.]DAT69580.1 MAG TPA: hypothetical protein [Caudoviricetes sp.]